MSSHSYKLTRPSNGEVTLTLNADTRAAYSRTMRSCLGAAFGTSSSYVIGTQTFSRVTTPVAELIVFGKTFDQFMENELEKRFRYEFGDNESRYRISNETGPKGSYLKIIVWFRSSDYPTKGVEFHVYTNPTSSSLLPYIMGFEGAGEILERLITSSGFIYDQGVVKLNVETEGIVLGSVVISSDVYSTEGLLGFTSYPRLTYGSWVDASQFFSMIISSQLFTLDVAGLDANLVNTVPNPSTALRQFQAKVVETYNRNGRGSIPATLSDAQKKLIEKSLSGFNFNHTKEELIRRHYNSSLLDMRLGELRASLGLAESTFAKKLSRFRRSYPTKQGYEFAILSSNPVSLVSLFNARLEAQAES